MVRLGALSDEMTPVLTDLGAVAPDINRMVIAARPVLERRDPGASSRSARRPRSARRRCARRCPVITDLRELASAVRPVGANARQLLESFQRTDGIERFMDYVFYQVAAINGFDSFGHYLRAGLIVNQCSTYAIAAGRSAARRTSRAPRASSAAAAASRRRAARPGAAAHGGRAREGARPAGPPRARSRQEKVRRLRERRSADQVKRDAAPPSRRRRRRRPPEPPPAADEQSQTETLLDYLFGGDE